MGPVKKDLGFHFSFALLRASMTDAQMLNYENLDASSIVIKKF